MRIFAFIVAIALVFMAPPKAFASTHDKGPVMGITVMPLAHNQLDSFNQHRSAIVALAATVEDATLAELSNYVKAQHRACLFGIMPASMSDQLSPFHTCTHATLAGTQAMLERLKQLMPNAPELQALNAKVEASLLEAGGLSLCLNSDQRFNTAQVIGPNWPDVPNHRVSALTLGLPMLLLMLAGVAFATRRRQTGPHMALKAG